ncbi:MAG TPA: hypothetical protein VEL82_00360 [Thermoplasmata archaeon]|nr:hypothetical protein [Thermoplasmata archaeon]
MAEQDLERLERSLLLHLLEHRGQQIRFEADQWTTEFGIARKFSNEDPATLKNALRSLEMSRMVFRRTQYVVGYSEPKHVFSLTPTGHRKALEHLRELTGAIPDDSEAPPDGSESGAARGTRDGATSV